MDSYFNVSRPFERLLGYTNHTKTTYFHLKSMDSLISLALLSNVATGQEKWGFPGGCHVCACARAHVLCARVHFNAARENAD